ncbi:MAG: hypothetical protein A2Z93_02140 [Curvibacter sp. GWA2_64_110]|nr:MAG: hypothetical protein A2Z93_02140 [Curvibacter sp. GWA2_64_110]HCY16576.1 DUF2721 domain-containing protein [Curvibacter sp.]
MSFFVDPSTVTHGIQLAVAPVFLLTAVSGMIGAVAGRLARIIDRARVLEERLRDSADTEFIKGAYAELVRLRRRGLLANGAIGFLTLCAFMIGLTIILLFLGETTAFQGESWAIVSFLFGVFCFMLALSCFLAETWMATRILNFGKPKS